jgi:hypothetical protein
MARRVIDITDDLAVRQLIDAEVDHHRARPDIVGGDEPRPAGSPQFGAATDQQSEEMEPAAVGADGQGHDERTQHGDHLVDCLKHLVAPPVHPRLNIGPLQDQAGGLPLSERR